MVYLLYDDDYKTNVAAWGGGGGCNVTGSGLSGLSREMENISRVPTLGNFVTIRTEASMQDVTFARLQSPRVRLPSPPSLKCNVLRESLSVDSENILYISGSL